jgi:acetyltransferase-like isoleucine patch superfamily enzyme
MNLLNRIFDDEHTVPAVRRLGSSVVGRIAGRLGTKHIDVAPGFFAHGPVWIEAVSSYGGRAFSPSIMIGRDFRASNGVHVSAIGTVTIGNDCLFGSGVLVTDNAHGSYDLDGGASDRPLSPPAARALSSKGGITNSSWLGENVVVLSGVDIGAGSVVSANSVVTHSLPPHCIAAGSPARVIRIFDASTGTWLASSGALSDKD